jgi:hypothetical protein
MENIKSKTVNASMIKTIFENSFFEDCIFVPISILPLTNRGM